MDRVEGSRASRGHGRRSRVPLLNGLGPRADAAGQTERASELEGTGVAVPRLAGERALGLDTTAALDSFERALALTPAGHPERAAALARFGEAALHAGRPARGSEALEEAIAASDTGDPIAAARAMGTLGIVYFRPGRSALDGAAAQAVALLEPLPPGPG